MATKLLVSGNVQDVFGVAATSGYVEFKLQPYIKGVFYYVAGEGFVDPSPVRTTIDGSGNFSVEVWGNDSISPANTTYTLTFAPENHVVSVINGLLIAGLGPSYDLNNPQFAPRLSLQPQYQTIVGNALDANLLPAADSAFTVGQPDLRWAGGYFNVLRAWDMTVFDFLSAVNAAFSSLQVNAVTNGTGLAASTYTPGFTGTVNIASIGFTYFMYTRIGNLVDVKGTFSVTPTAGGGTFTAFNVSVPIGSTMGAGAAAGKFTMLNGDTGIVLPNTNTVQVQFTSNTNTLQLADIDFRYVVA